jgi:hypothetical protein
MRGRPAGRFLGDMTTPRRPGESRLQYLVGIFSQNFTLRVSIVRLLKYEHLHVNVRILLTRNRWKYSGGETMGKTLRAISVFFPTKNCSTDSPGLLGVVILPKNRPTGRPRISESSLDYIAH